MKKLLAAVLGCALAAPASAVSFGTSTALSTRTGGDPFGIDDVFLFGFAPTLDIRVDPVTVQLHVLEFVDSAVDGDVYLGGNLYYEMYRAPVAGPWAGVVQPGLSADVCCNPLVLALGAEARFGIEAASGMGFGIYVVPGAGIVSGPGGGELYTGGALQVSVWLGGGGGGGVAPASEE